MTGSQHTGPGLSPRCEGEFPLEPDVETQKPPRPIVMWMGRPLIEPGVEECIQEVRAFARGGRPGLERLKLVLSGIFDAFLVDKHDDQRRILQECGLPAVKVQYRATEILVVDRVSFLIPQECQSPAWTRRVRPCFHSGGACSSYPSTAPGSPA